MHKILVFSMTRMGDIIQSIPFFRRLRKKHPNAKIDLFVEQCFGDVARFLPGIDDIIEVKLEDLLLCFDQERGEDLPKGIAYYSELVRDLRSRGYHEVWNLTHTKPFTVLSALIGGENANGVTLDDAGMQTVNKSWLKYFYATNLARPWCQFNLVDIYANCVDGIEMSYGRSVRIDPDKYLESFPEQLSKIASKHRVAVHPGASQKAKTWPLSDYVELVNRLAQSSCEVVLIGGPADRQMGQRMTELTDAVNMIGKTTVRELAAVLKSCDLLISNDSGPMHIAAAVDTKVIAITLGSALGSETAPFGDSHWVIEPRLECFPCSTERVCKIQHCAKNIKVDHIVALVDHCLNGQSLSPSLYGDRGIRLYRTRHEAESGQLELVRCGNHADDERDRYNGLFRQLWPVWLDESSNRLSETHMIDSEIRKTAVKIIQEAEIAETLCNEMASCDPHSESSCKKVERLIIDLNRTDNRLKELLSSKSVLQSVLAYLMIEKSSVKGGTLDKQARQTALIYRSLKRMFKAILLERGQLDSTKKKEDKEVCYENLTEWS